MALRTLDLFRGIESTIGNIFYPSGNDFTGRYFGLTPWTAIITMGILGVGVPAAFAFISVIILTVINYSLVKNPPTGKRRKRGFDFESPHWEEDFDWLTILEVIEEKVHKYFPDQKCTMEKLCKKLSKIHQEAPSSEVKEKKISKPTLALAEIRKFFEFVQDSSHLARPPEYFSNFFQSKKLYKSNDEKCNENFCQSLQKILTV